MNVGGPALQIMGLMESLPSDLYEQVLLTGYCGDSEVDFLQTQAGNFEATYVPGLGRSLTPSHDVKALVHIGTFMRKFRPDIVHTHTAKAGFLGRVARLYVVPRAHGVHTFHGHLLHGYFSPTRTKALIATERILAHSSSRLVAVGEQVMADLLEAGVGTREKFSVVPPGVDIRMLPPRDRSRDQLKLSESSFVVLFLGRLTGIKRVDRLADVASLVKKMNPNVRFLVAGDGDRREYLVRRIQEEQLPVQILGMRSDIETLFSASDVLVLTSDNEGMPVGLIQGSLAGLPAVSTRVGSVPEVVIDGVTGWLTSTDPREIALCLRGAAEDLAGTRRRGMAAQSYAEQHFSRQRLVGDHDRIYQSLLRGNRH